ncbi:MAG: hypothetical protein MPW16_06175 [Candidatus Manganitrophus sp.]|nr:MAG: hypothetical protein MPW16_06175 [Candidatus Manganitrophus sp.]
MPKAKKQEGSNEEPPLPPSSEIEPLLQEMKKVLSLLREKIEERAQQLREAQTKLKESERLTSGQIAAFVADQFRNSLCVIKHASRDLKAKMSNHPQSGDPEETTSVTDGRCKKSRTGLTAGKRK